MRRGEEAETKRRGSHIPSELGGIPPRARADNIPAPAVWLANHHEHRASYPRNGTKGDQKSSAVEQGAMPQEHKQYFVQEKLAKAISASKGRKRCAAFARVLKSSGPRSRRE